MKLPLQLVASIFLTSAYGSVWPYRVVVGVGQSAPGVFVAAAYAVAPAVSLLLAVSERETSTVVAGPRIGPTVVKGSSSGAVNVIPAGSLPVAVENVLPLAEQTTAAAESADGSILIKGASAGPVTLIAPSDSNNRPSTLAERNDGTVSIGVSTGDPERSETAVEGEQVVVKVTGNGETTIGIASEKAVIGPSTGPVVIAGPVASVVVSNPVASAVTVITSDTDTTPGIIEGAATRSSTIESSAESTTTVVENSGNSVAYPDNLIAPGPRVTVTEAPLSKVVVSAPTVPSAVIPGFSGSVSTVGVAGILSKMPSNPLPSKW